MKIGLALSVCSARAPGASVAPIDPATLSLTQWVRDYPGSATWTSLASAGVSGDGAHRLVTGGADPSAGTALNGHGVATFNGTTQFLLQENAQSTYAAAGAFSGWAVVKPTDTGSTMHVYAGQNTAAYSQRITTSTAVWQQTINAATKAQRTIGGFGGWHILTWRYDLVNSQVGRDEVPGAAGGSTSVAFSTPESDLTTIGRVGCIDIAGNTLFFQGDLAEIAMSNAAISDANFAGVISFLKARYGI